MLGCFLGIPSLNVLSLKKMFFYYFFLFYLGGGGGGGGEKYIRAFEADQSGEMTASCYKAVEMAPPLFCCLKN